jgi:hypothetical protein
LLTVRSRTKLGRETSIELATLILEDWSVSWCRQIVRPRIDQQR